MFYEVLGDEPVSLDKKAAVEAILRINENGESLIVTSVITHLEVLPKKRWRDQGAKRSVGSWPASSKPEA
jgi:hypothetical protein